jgi:hypothetical protein
MANEITVPLLPCRSSDEIVEFYGMLGFSQTYYQTLPNPYVALRRGDINLHFFGIPGFKPEDSYGSCLVIVPDTGELYRSSVSMPGPPRSSTAPSRGTRTRHQPKSWSKRSLTARNSPFDSTIRLLPPTP